MKFKHGEQRTREITAERGWYANEHVSGAWFIGCTRPEVPGGISPKTERDLKDLRDMIDEILWLATTK